MPESPLHPPSSCLTAGGDNSSSSQCTYDPSPPDYREIVRLSRLQSSDPYSVWEPQHECGIWDSQISAGERQEVPGMPVECPFLPSLSKTASTKQLQLLENDKKYE
jgi:hypothetical protein